MNKSFTLFCLMILINGNNFVDGINTLLIGYNIILTIFLLVTFKEFLHNSEILEDYLIILLVLLVFNFNGKIILGDAGAYILAFFLGVYLIDFARNNPYLSPFFIISLLWYPCFELLFSIIRRLKYLKKTYVFKNNKKIFINGLEAVIAGETSITEILRVSQE